MDDPSNAAYDDDAVAEYPESEHIARAIVPKVAAVLSLFGSSMILTELYLDWRGHRQGNKARDGATSRILMSMSISDIIFSFGYFLTTWPAPSDLTYIRFNVGNQATCTLQGFIIQLGYVASPLFNVTLALFFLLRIRYRWTDSRLKRMEPWIQGCIWAFALACAIYPIPLGMYNNAWEICWIESYPMDCLDSHRYGKEASTCTRGDNAWIHSLVFQVFPPWICVFCALIFMGMIYATVRQVEERNTRYAGSHYSPNAAAAAVSSASDASPGHHSHSQQQQHSTSYKSRFSSIMSSLSRSYAASPPGASTTTPVNATSAVAVVASNSTARSSSSPQQPASGDAAIINPISASEANNNNNTAPGRRPRKAAKNRHYRSDKVATQAMWYIAAFFATYLLDFISSICWYAFDLWWFWLDIFAYFFLPLQGFFNFCVFMRSRKMKSRLGRVARKVFCCLEGKVSICKGILRFCHSCCGKDIDNNNNNNNNTTSMARGGCSDNKNSVNQCPAAALLPPVCNNDNTTDHDPERQSVKGSFASPPTSSARSAIPTSTSSCCFSSPPPPRNPCGNNDDIIVTDENASSLPQTSSPSTNSRARLDDDQEKNPTTKWDETS
jgi:hypothetical protein